MVPEPVVPALRQPFSEAVSIMSMSLEHIPLFLHQSRIDDAVMAAERAAGVRDPVLAGYVLACLFTFIRRRDEAHATLDGVAAALLDRGDWSDEVSRKIMACHIVSRLERGGLDRHLVEIGAIMSKEYRIEDHLAELFALASTPAGGCGMAGRLLFLPDIGWNFRFDAVAMDNLRRFVDWLPAMHNSRSSVGTFYQDFDKYMAENRGRERRAAAVAALLLDRIGMEFFHGPRRLLDAGCGDAIIPRFLRRTVAVGVTGVDMAPAAGPLVVRSVPDADFLVCDLERIPFRDGSFDLVLSSDVLEHTAYPDRIVRELHRLTAPGGYLFISLPDGRFDTYIGHVNFFSTQSLRALLSGVGGEPIVGLNETGLWALLRK